jgi:hypothetical protein
MLFVVGCGSGDAPPVLPEPVPFEGIVKLDGKPVESATIMFHPRSEKGFHGAVGTTDASGKYVLETDIGNNKTKKGIVPGVYDVTVNLLVGLDGTVLKFDPNVPPMNRGGHESIPMRYSTVNDMGLSCDTATAGGKFDIEMVSGGGP